MGTISRKLRRLGSLAALALSAAVAGNPAKAVEFSTPILPGATIGLPYGAAAPAGIYFSTINLYYQGRATNGSGDAIPFRFNFYETIPVFLVSTGEKIFGANYSFYAAQPLMSNSANAFGTHTGSDGPFNTLLSPIQLSWALSNGFFFNAGLTIYLPTAYTSRVRTSTGNGFTTFQPDLALTYLNDGWNLTAHLMLNFNQRNNLTGYQTGNLLGIDYTATKSIGAWTVGLGGYYTKQWEPDRLNGTVVAASAYNSRGNKIEQFAIGPYVSYDFGSFSVSAWYNQGIYAKNGPNANVAWLKVAVPLGNPFGPSQPVAPTQLPDRTERGVQSGRL